MREESSLRRQWILLKTLSSRRFGLTIREMAEEARVSEKTVRRDLAVFRDFGFPVVQHVGEFGRKTWRIESPWNQPPLCFTFDEAVALSLGRRMLDPLAGTFFWEAAQRAYRKIQAAFDRRALSYLEQFSASFHLTVFGASDYTSKGELIDALMLAIEESKAVYLSYQSERATEPSPRDVYPYGMIYAKGSLYLVALHVEDDKLKHYKVDRIDTVEPTNFPFTRPHDFDLAAHLASAFGAYHVDGALRPVRVRFTPRVARFVLESTWHPSQRLTRQRDGSLLAEFQLSCFQEFKSWILSFGRNAIVLEPESLRVEIAEEAKAVAALYTSKDEPAPVFDGADPSSCAGRPAKPYTTAKSEINTALIDAAFADPNASMGPRR